MAGPIFPKPLTQYSLLIKPNGSPIHSTSSLSAPHPLSTPHFLSPHLTISRASSFSLLTLPPTHTTHDNHHQPRPNTNRKIHGLLAVCGFSLVVVGFSLVVASFSLSLTRCRLLLAVSHLLFVASYSSSLTCPLLTRRLRTPTTTKHLNFWVFFI